MNKVHQVEILRGTRFDVSGGEAAPHYSHVDVLEIRWPDGGTSVMERCHWAPGATHNGDPVTGEVWIQAMYDDYDHMSALVARQERERGHLVGKPVTLDVPGQKVMVDSPGHPSSWAHGPCLGHRKPDQPAGTYPDRAELDYCDWECTI